MKLDNPLVLVGGALGAYLLYDHFIATKKPASSTSAPPSTSSPKPGSGGAGNQIPPPGDVDIAHPHVSAAALGAQWSGWKVYDASELWKAGLPTGGEFPQDTPKTGFVVSNDSAQAGMGYAGAFSAWLTTQLFAGRKVFVSPAPWFIDFDDGTEAWHATIDAAPPLYRRVVVP